MIYIHQRLYKDSKICRRSFGMSGKQFSKGEAATHSLLIKSKTKTLNEFYMD